MSSGVMSCAVPHESQLLCCDECCVMSCAVTSGVMSCGVKWCHEQCCGAEGAAGAKRKTRTPHSDVGKKLHIIYVIIYK